MAKVELKQPIVQAIVEDLTDAQSAVIVNYCGLTVAQDTELRKQLREAGVIYKVCKNTMMKRAFEGTDSHSLTNIWKDRTLLQFLKKMQQHRQESSAISLRKQKLLK